ncbi:MAG: penicillin-binding protein, partial [Frankiales bacterium]|nr:penicillin-binding protein [Frankiales bacterium]
REAIISAEDGGFLDHKGVDPVATIRAAVQDLTGGRRQGGSTITQQYVKNVYVGNDRTLLRKVQEAGIAVRLEHRKSKQDILTDYLNVLFLGNSTYGVQAASRYYYGVPVIDLGLVETPGRGMPRDAVLALARASMLAGIAPAPSVWNPVKDFSTARVRQRYTLNQMVLNGFITAPAAAAAFARQSAVLPLRETEPEPPSSAPEYADLVKQQLKAQYADDPDLLDRGGFRVKTALDTDLQEAMTRAVREVLPNVDNPEAAVVAVDITNGDVKAMTTLRRRPQVNDTPPIDGYERGGFNLATNALRSTGSTIKPFTLAVALEKGLTLDTRRPAPACDTIQEATGSPYRYCNAAGESGVSLGSLTLRRALQASVNTVYVPLAIEVGRPRIKQLMVDSGVVAAKATPTRKNPFATNVTSFGLGTTAEVTPLSMANAFGTLMNHGLHHPPRYVVETRDADGSLITEGPKPPQPNRAMPADIADQVVDAMSGVTAPGGTAPRAKQDFPVFGKTGTTNDSADAWFIGCARSPQNICLATWMGFDVQTCAGVVGRACGGMLNVNGVKQVFGGTLPAAVFDRTFEILREIQAGKRPGLGEAGPTAPAGAAPTAGIEASPRANRPRTRRSSAPVAPANPVQPATLPRPSPSAPPPEPAPEPSPRPSSVLPPPPPGPQPSPTG